MFEPKKLLIKAVNQGFKHFKGILVGQPSDGSKNIIFTVLGISGGIREEFEEFEKNHSLKKSLRFLSYSGKKWVWTNY